MKEEFNLSKKRKMLFEHAEACDWKLVSFTHSIREQDKEFIKRRIERIKLIIKLYPHKHGEELAGQLIEDLIKDAGDELIW